MVILRPTRKLRSLLPATATSGSISDTALGDWYINRIVVDRQPLLLLVSSASLLPMVVPARDVRNLPLRLSKLVESRLKRLDIGDYAIDAERNAMTPIEIGPTVDRSVLGIIVDFAKSIPNHLEPGHWNESTLKLLEDRLSETPCYASRSFDDVVFPTRKATDLLRMKWLADGPLTPATENRRG